MGKRAAPVSSFPKVKATAKAKTQAQPKRARGKKKDELPPESNIRSFMSHPNATIPTSSSSSRAAPATAVKSKASPSSKDSADVAGVLVQDARDFWKSDHDKGHICMFY